MKKFAAALLAVVVLSIGPLIAWWQITSELDAIQEQARRIKTEHLGDMNKSLGALIESSNQMLADLRGIVEISESIVESTEAIEQAAAKENGE